ncbi:4-coumarate--CoA ligase-like 4 [Ananas comosus]|uniref:4-coumarate--CoA ligase-like 4 n=1 Tax=Ananas comosus TaxID=4615 RepID=A0A199VHP0_ANACO|nr:4-coumarate--CoA ligase-like 4 [Ananas comosus]
MAYPEKKKGSEWEVDPRSGFCAANATFYSKRRPVALPAEPDLDVTTFLTSRRHSGTTALIDAATGRRVSFPELWRSVAAVASSLRAPPLSLRKGLVVLLLSPNSIHFPVVALAAMSLGAVITTTNPVNTPAEIARQVDDASPAVAFAPRALVPSSRAPRPPHRPPRRLPPRRRRRRRRRRSPDPLHHRRHARRRSRPHSPPDDGARAPGRPRDAALLLGDDGASKGGRHPPQPHLHGPDHHQPVQPRRTGDLPLHDPDVPRLRPRRVLHGASGGGIHHRRAPQVRDGGDAARDRGYGVTYLPLVPPILVAMLGVGSGKLRLGRVRRIHSSGAPLSREVIEGFRDKYPGIEILQAYGLTETTALGASTDSPQECRRYGSAGLLAPNTEARVVDPDTGKPLPVNRTGELWIRGPYVMKGYFKNEEATRSTLDSEGWLRTGDLCYIDEDGYLFVVDRLKELIKYKGYQVPPAELEALLLTHPDIVDAAVIPFPDKAAGQVPMAYVVRKDGSNCPRMR